MSLQAEASGLHCPLPWGWGGSGRGGVDPELLLQQVLAPPVPRHRFSEGQPRTGTDDNYLMAFGGGLQARWDHLAGSAPRVFPAPGLWSAACSAHSPTAL